jgi:hypothetical protein
MIWKDFLRCMHDVRSRDWHRLIFVQAALAAGLLQLLPLKPRTIGLIGTMASALNCYMLYPALPKAKKA